MEYHQEFILDFAERTRSNLEFIEAAEAEGDNVYEVTQLANSLLGLLVFPREHYLQSIPDTPLAVLVDKGWPKIKTTYGVLPQETLQQLVRMLRNSIAHCNVEFSCDRNRQVDGIKVWNNKNNQKSWEAQLSIADLRCLAFKFIELIESENSTETTT